MKTILPLPPILIGIGNHKHGSEAAIIIHNAYRKNFWSSVKIRHIPEILLLIILSPFVYLAHSLYYTITLGKLVSRNYQVSIFKQIIRQIQAYFKYSITPRLFYTYELYNSQHYRFISDYIHRHETRKGLYQLLRNYYNGSTRPLTDKKIFDRMCTDNQLPHVSVLMTIKKGIISFSQTDSNSLPMMDLIVKPVEGRAGKGIFSLIYLENGSYKCSNGDVYTPKQALEFIKQLSFQREYIVQELFKMDTRIADLSSGALNTVRIVTMINEAGDYEVVNAVYRISAKKGAIVDNFHAGGLATRIDLDSGTLGQAIGAELTKIYTSSKSLWHTTHPTTNAIISGRTLPDWNSVKSLAIRAHQTFNCLLIIAWDIAITSRGIMLIEGNSRPGFETIQRTHRYPVSRMRFGEIMAYHVSKAIQSKQNIRSVH